MNRLARLQSSILHKNISLGELEIEDNPESTIETSGDSVSKSNFESKMRELKIQQAQMKIERERLDLEERKEALRKAKIDRQERETRFRKEYDRSEYYRELRRRFKE